MLIALISEFVTPMNSHRADELLKALYPHEERELNDPLDDTPAA